jgi:lysophospholipase L1-like esterase
MIKKRVLPFLLSLIICIGLSVALDRVVGLFVPQTAQMMGLIFPPNARHEFKTLEFSFTLETNSFGFRDREFDPQRAMGRRILAIGDSFTYGWGVEGSQSWPKVLESRLRADGQNVEIANLGKPGASPQNYAEIAEKATPLFKPDLIIIAVLQGDDLAQMEQSIQPASSAADENKRLREPNAVRRGLQTTAAWLYPHFISLLNDRVKPAPTLDYQWKEDARLFLAGMTPEGRARYENLDAQIKDAFINGELNPALVYLGIIKPDYFLQTLDVNSTKVKALISEMSKQLARIKSIALKNNAEVIVISVPYGVYVDPRSLKSRQHLGFAVVPEMLTTSAEDDAIRSASQMAAIPFYEVTREFRHASIDTAMFFDLDGHFNPAGHRLFADALAPIIEKR